MCIIRFGGDEAEYLTLTVHDRNIPDSTDYWDGNWLSCTAEVSVGTFRGSLNGLLRSDEFAQCLTGLEELYRRLNGEALFETLEAWLAFRVIGDGKGHIEVQGRLRDDQVHGNTLEFRLFFDQTYLPSIIRQLRATLEQFPIVGRR